MSFAETPDFNENKTIFNLPFDRLLSFSVLYMRSAFYSIINDVPDINSCKNARSSTPPHLAKDVFPTMAVSVLSCTMHA